MHKNNERIGSRKSASTLYDVLVADTERQIGIFEIRVDGRNISAICWYISIICDRNARDFRRFSSFYAFGSLR